MSVNGALEHRLIPATDEICQELLKVFDLHGRPVRKLVITCEVNKAVMVHAEIYVTKDKGEKMLKVLGEGYERSADSFELVECKIK